MLGSFLTYSPKKREGPAVIVPHNQLFLIKIRHPPFQKGKILYHFGISCALRIFLCLFTGARKKLKNNDRPVSRKPKARPRASNKKRGQKFSEFARNFSQYISDSDDSIDSLESVQSSLGLDGDFFIDETKSLDSPKIDDSKSLDSPRLDYDDDCSANVLRSNSPEPEPIISAPLLLPPSSGDLLIPVEILMKALQGEKFI